MQNYPLLAETEFTENKILHRIRVFGGLHYIKGNSLPHFSLTADIDYKTARGWRESSGGMCHDEILHHFPRFADLAALHLSDINGLPMYAVENGFYHLGGTHWAQFNPQFVANHFRINDPVALRDQLNVKFFEDSKAEQAAAKQRVSDYVEQQKRRYAQEAADCITKHDLRIFGDVWEQSQTEELSA